MVPISISTLEWLCLEILFTLTVTKSSDQITELNQVINYNIFKMEIGLQTMIRKTYSNCLEDDLTKKCIHENLVSLGKCSRSMRA